MHFNIQQVELDDIHTNDYFFRITTDKPIDDLIRSISDIGLINPPVLIKHENAYIIVSGFRRIEAISIIGEKKVTAQVAESQKHSLVCAKIAISDNSFQRPLNLIEQARAIQILSIFHDSKNDLSSAAKALLLPENLSIIDKLKRISKFDTEIQEYILADSVSLSTALMLEKFKENNRILIARLLNNLKLSLNKQREMVTMLSEISCRDRIDVSEILEGEKIKEILANQDLDRNQKAYMMQILLKKRRFPEITKAESDFFSCIKMLNLDHSTKLIPPKFFEGSEYTLNFLFNSFEELKICESKLKRIIQNPEIKKILK
jgi:ParB family chromosome partitioning protein